MTAAVLLKELEAMGATVTTDGAALRIKAPKGSITPALADSVRRHKPELLALLAGGGEPANDPPATINETIPEETRQRLVTAWRQFLLAHGPTLLARDWHPHDLVGEMDPETATTWDTMPGVAVILSEWWTLDTVTGGYLRFALPGGLAEMIFTRAGTWLGEAAAETWLERWHERTGILMADAGLDEHSAEIRAGLLLVREARERATLH